MTNARHFSSFPASPLLAQDAASAHPLAWRLLLGLSGAVLLLHVLLSGRYGYFRDELYFLDCGRHLAWGYVDMAPMLRAAAQAGLRNLV